MGVFGYMGSGKSYLVSALIEGSVEEMSGLNCLPAPLATIVFNYRRIPTDRFELSSLVEPNDSEEEVNLLEQEYGATPTGISRVRILCLPDELTDERQEEYGDLPASELLFRPQDLTVEDWELLMGHPQTQTVYAQGLRNALAGLHHSGELSLDSLRAAMESSNLGASSKAAAAVRLDFVSRYLSAEDGVDFASIVEPGWVTVFDLRGSLFSKEDALRFFLVCTSSISRLSGSFNKLVVFDEAHEYMSTEFGETMESRIRLMRHEGTSYLFATQDVKSVPPEIRRFIATQFVFNLGTSQNIVDLKKHDEGFRGLNEKAFLNLEPGHCLVKSSKSTQDIFRTPRIVRVRPRASKHGGRSRVFLDDA